MGPIEVLWISIAVIFMFIGIVREYPRELGVTVVILVAILLLKLFGDQALDFVIAQQNRIGLSIFNQADAFLFMTLFQVIFIAIVFAAYSGETLSFHGQTIRGTAGAAVSALVGLLNGYLVTGTLWYYLDKYGYPIARLGLIKLPLDQTAQTMVDLLPQRVLDARLLIILIGGLILLRVRR